MTNSYFGIKDPQATYQTRHGVYAIIANQTKDHIILVQAPNGAWFLPGGEIEEGENHQTALERELLEELGFSAQLGHYYGQADEYFYSNHRDQHFYNPAYLYEVTSFQHLSDPLEAGNHSAWFPIEEAICRLKRGSHKWGIQQWKIQHSQ